MQSVVYRLCVCFCGLALAVGLGAAPAWAVAPEAYIRKPEDLVSAWETAVDQSSPIAVTSTPGEGTVFTVRLPLERIGEPGEASPASAAEVIALTRDADAADEEAPALRILAAEDHPVNQLVLRTLLQQLGCEVTLVGDGLEAVEAFGLQAWDVVLLDIQMPNMDGEEAARAIRRVEADRSLPRTPLIALTANAMAHQVQAYRAAGFDDHVAKPIDANDLIAAINRSMAMPEPVASCG